MKKIKKMTLWQWGVVALVALVAIGGTAIASIGGTTASPEAANVGTVSDIDLGNLDLIDAPGSLDGMAGGGGGGAAGGGGAEIQVAQYN